MEVFIGLDKNLKNIPFKSIIDLHENISSTFGYYSSIVAGDDFMEFVANSIKNEQNYFDIYSENKGAIASYSGKNGKKLIFYKKGVSKGFVMFSRNWVTNNITMYRYVIYNT